MKPDPKDQPAVSISCAIPSSSSDRVMLSHGEGGRQMRRLIRDTIAPILGLTEDLGDAANIGTIDGEVVITTDSYVVSPLVFPGGDIGSLAVYGTVNDLAMAGAKPLRLTLSLIMEDGLPMSVLREVLEKIAAAARECEVTIVAGDTKVVPAGAADGIFINTCGVGVLRPDAPRGPRSICPGDSLIVSGPIGQHGIAVLSARQAWLFAGAAFRLWTARSIRPRATGRTRFETSCDARRDAGGCRRRAA